jgi:hypothetical protein
MDGIQGCPGSRMMTFEKEKQAPKDTSVGRTQSQLQQWPIQLHLIAPNAPYYQNADVLLTADCVAYALGDFHRGYLKDRSLAIACPKLDAGQDIYLDKIKAWIDDAEINSLTVLIMQVPCCTGLLNLARQAVQDAERKIALNYSVVGIQGDILQAECIHTSMPDPIITLERNPKC